MDIVNEFFRKHYPADWDTAWKMKQCSQTYGKEYNGTEPAKRIFPEMVCADGFKMSVQGHFGAYSIPRGDFEDSYSMVEISTAPRAEPLLEEHSADGHYDDFSIYGYVPIQLVEKVIAKHGGLAAVPS